MWYKENASAKSAATFTANLSGAAMYRRIMVWQISGAATSGALDQVSTPFAASATAQTCSNITTSQADEIILAGISEWAAHSFTAGSSFTNRYVNSGTDFIALDRIVASTGTYPNGTLATVSSASDNKYACVMASFKANLSGGTPDITAPTTPTNLSATAVSSSGINLSWSASTDAVGVTGYKVYRAGTQIGTTASTSYSDTGLSASTSYSYTVAAYDAAGNTSAQSSSASATTQSAPVSDTTAPTVPANLSASAVSSSAINLSWSASTDAVGVTGYKVYRAGTQIGTTASTNYSDTGLSASTSYSYTVAAYDAAGNTY
jgi:chitodextrinase